jgi:hypothetical protein
LFDVKACSGSDAEVGGKNPASTWKEREIGGGGRSEKDKRTMVKERT